MLITLLDLLKVVIVLGWILLSIELSFWANIIISIWRLVEQWLGSLPNQMELWIRITGPSQVFYVLRLGKVLGAHSLWGEGEVRGPLQIVVCCIETLWSWPPWQRFGRRRALRGELLDVKSLNLSKNIYRSIVLLLLPLNLFGDNPVSLRWSLDVSIVVKNLHLHGGQLTDFKCLHIKVVPGRSFVLL